MYRCPSPWTGKALRFGLHCCCISLLCPLAVHGRRWEWHQGAVARLAGGEWLYLCVPLTWASLLSFVWVLLGWLWSLISMLAMQSVISLCGMFPGNSPLAPLLHGWLAARATVTLRTVLHVLQYSPLYHLYSLMRKLRKISSLFHQFILQGFPTPSWILLFLILLVVIK